jgi:hypothetical protein
LVRAIAGNYDDAKGAKLLVEADGKVTRIRIHWSAPRGPVTRAALGLNDRGDVVLYEWTAATNIEISRQGKEPASRISFLERQFNRAR